MHRNTLTYVFPQTKKGQLEFSLSYNLAKFPVSVGSGLFFQYRTAQAFVRGVRLDLIFLFPLEFG